MIEAPRTVLTVLGRGLVDPSTPVVAADDPGVTRGDGCFEGCRLIGGQVAKLDAHLARMARSARSLGIDFDAGAWTELVGQAVAAWDSDDEAGVRLVLTRGPAGGDPVGWALVTPTPAAYARVRRDGLRVVTLDRGLTSDAFGAAPWLLGGVKALSYAVNMAAQREAERRGADDAIFVSADGYVLESPTGTVVWSDGRTSGGRQLWTTPTGATGILPGTTQELLFERAAAAGWQTGHRLVTVPELLAADVVWLVGSVRGPVDVVDVDGTPRARHPEIDTEIRRLVGF